MQDTKIGLVINVYEAEILCLVLQSSKTQQQKKNVFHDRNIQLIISGPLPGPLGMKSCTLPPGHCAWLTFEC